MWPLYAGLLYWSCIRAGGTINRTTIIFVALWRRMWMQQLVISLQCCVIRTLENEGSTHVEPQRSISWTIHVAHMTGKETFRVVQRACLARCGSVLTIWRGRKTAIGGSGSSLLQRLKTFRVACNEQRHYAKFIPDGNSKSCAFSANQTEGNKRPWTVMLRVHFRN
jgi:hypothetical protein